MKLKSAIARRLYRFLDKRFHRIARAEYDLKNLAYEKIGLSRKTPTGDLKRQLRKAIEELEKTGFIKPLPRGERFKKISAGQWHVIFERVADKKSSKVSSQQLSAGEQEVAQKLAAHGIEERTAYELAQNFDASLILEKIALLEKLLAVASPRVPQNPAGYLISSIKGKYRSVKKPDSTSPQIRTTPPKSSATQTKHEAAHSAQETAIQSFWDELTDEARKLSETEALANPPTVERILAKGSANGVQIARKSALYRYAKKKLLEAGRWPS